MYPLVLTDMPELANLDPMEPQLKFAHGDPDVLIARKPRFFYLKFYLFEELTLLKLLVMHYLKKPRVQVPNQLQVHIIFPLQL